MPRLTLCAASLTAAGVLGCYGLDHDRVPDAGPPDAAPPPGPTIAGTIAIHEVDVQGAPELGSGMLVSIDFRDVAIPPVPVFDEMPGSPFGCRVFELDPAAGAAVGLDEGEVTITVEDGDPSFPPCAFDPGRGYRCVVATGT